VDQYGKTIAFLLSKQCDQAAARCFLNKAIGRHGLPDKITLDGSKAKASAIQCDHDDPGTSIDICQSTYLNHMVEPDHLGVKRVTRPMLGFKSFDAARSPLTGMELVRMIRKDQREGKAVEGLSAAAKFSTLAL